MLAWMPQAHGVPLLLCPDAGGGPQTTLSRVQTHTGPYSWGIPQDPISPRQFLTAYYWRIRPVRYFSPFQRCCEMLILAGTGLPVHSARTQGCSWELPGYN